MNQIKNVNRNISLRRKRVFGRCFPLPEGKESELDIATVSVWFLLGSLSNDDGGDRRRQRKKQLVFMSKITAVNVHHAFKEFL